MLFVFQAEAVEAVVVEKMRQAIQTPNLAVLEVALEDLLLLV
jgi:hypothetical protein